MFGVSVHLKLWISLSVIWVTATANMMQTEQRFAIEPQDQTAVEGSSVTLPCRVINKLGSLQWTRDDFALGPHRSLAEFYRYRMIGSDEEGDFSLEINPVWLEDDAKYQCQVSSGPNGEAGIRSKYARLIVLKSPREPRIIQGSKMETTEDSEVKLECVSSDGKPPAEITWIDGLGNVVTQKTPSMRITYSTERNALEEKLVTAKSVLTIRPKKEYHNTTFICQAHNTADRTHRSAKIRILVKYAPKVIMTMIPNTHMLIEGSDAKLVCQADANPPDVHYHWYVNQERKFTSNPNEFLISNVSRHQHDSIVKCEAFNMVGKSEDTQTLEVTYAPQFRQKPRSVQADLGAKIQLTCDVEGNPPPRITWTHGRDKVVGNSPNLTLIVSQEKTGRYYCRAHVPGFPEIGAEASVRMNGRPSIQKNVLQYGIMGDEVRVECSAYSIPLPDRTSWSFNSQLIDSSQRDYSILEDPLPDGVRSTLVIRKSRQEHYGTYNCSVTNPYGTDAVDILLKPQKSFPLTVVLTAAVGCGVVLITLIMIILMCQRKEKKPLPVLEAKHIEKQCKESDKSSTISELKLEMRTGSSASNINCESDYGGGRDSDSIITRVAVPLAGPVPIDQRYSMNRYSSGDFSDPHFQKGGQNNNGYVPYLDYSRADLPSTRTTLTNGISPIVTGVSSLTTNTSLDLRYSATYGNPYLRLGNHAALQTPNSGQQQQPPPPPYTTLRCNGSVPQLTAAVSASKLSPMVTTSSLSPCNASNKTHITSRSTTQATQATHV